MLTIENIPNENIYYFPRLTEKYNQLSDLYVQCTDTNKAIELYELCEYIERFIKLSLKKEPLTEPNISFIKDILTDNTYIQNEVMYLGFIIYTNKGKKVCQGYKNSIELQLLTEYLKNKKIKYFKSLDKINN